MKIKKEISSNRNNMQIEGLRGLAILLVVFYHFFYRFYEIYVSEGQSLFIAKHCGEMGVAIFLTITGYYLYPSKATNWLSYAKKRIIRIWPTYFVCITIIFIITHIGFQLPGRTVGIKDYIFNIVMINGFIGANCVDSAHWYITTILSFTIVASFFLFLKKENKIVFQYIWIIVMFSLQCLKIIMQHDSAMSKVLSASIVLLGNSYVGFCICGIAIRLWISNKKSYDLSIVVLFILGFTYTWMFMGFLQAIFLIISAFLLYAAQMNQLKLMEKKVMIMLGTISFSIYLIHQNIGYIEMLALSQIMGLQGHIVSLCILVTSILEGIVIYRFVECPARNLFRKKMYE